MLPVSRQNNVITRTGSFTGTKKGQFLITNTFSSPLKNTFMDFTPPPKKKRSYTLNIPTGNIDTFAHETQDNGQDCNQSKSLQSHFNFYCSAAINGDMQDQK